MPQTSLLPTIHTYGRTCLICEEFQPLDRLRGMLGALRYISVPTDTAEIWVNLMSTCLYILVHFHLLFSLGNHRHERVQRDGHLVLILPHDTVRLGLFRLRRELVWVAENAPRKGNMPIRAVGMCHVGEILASFRHHLLSRAEQLNLAPPSKLSHLPFTTAASPSCATLAFPAGWLVAAHLESLPDYHSR